MRFDLKAMFSFHIAIYQLCRKDSKKCIKKLKTWSNIPSKISCKLYTFKNSQCVYNYIKGKYFYFPLELTSMVGSEARVLQSKPVFSYISVWPWNSYWVLRSFIISVSYSIKCRQQYHPHRTVVKFKWVHAHKALRTE